MPATESGSTVYLQKYREPEYTVRAVDLEFSLAPESTLVRSRLEVERARETKAGTPMVLDGEALELLSIRVDGRSLAVGEYQVSDRALTLARPGRRFLLEIETRINPAANTELSGLYLSGGNYCTQCEAEGFRRITYFPDRPDVLATYTVRIEADRAVAPVLLCNGNPVRRGRLSGGRHYAVWHDPHPKPSYLFALVAGDLGSIRRRFVTSEGRPVTLAIHVQKGKERLARYAMGALVRSMRWDEEVFGCAYDLDVFNIVAVPDFNMGAMENKGLNIFNDKYILADPDTATDTDFSRIEAIIAHEYFHNWTGNRITCRDWFQLCLKEGLTVYRDQEFTSDLHSRAVKRIEDVALLKANQFPEDAGPLAHPVRPEQYREINNFYTATVYEKGAEIVRMIATLIGRKAFMRGMRLYLKRHDGEAATVEQFIACFEKASGTDLSQFFLWYSQAGTPRLHVNDSHDAARGIYRLQVEQSLPATPGQPEKKPMQIPLRIGLVGRESGRDLEPEAVEGAEWMDGVLVLRQPREEIVFSGIREVPVLSVNRAFSAPVNVEYRQSDRELLFLALNDSDEFSRWQSFQAMATRQSLAAMRSLQRNRKPRLSPAFLDAAVELAKDGSLEPAFRAMLLTIPSEGELAQNAGRNIDPDAIHKARSALQAALGERLSGIRSEIGGRFLSNARFVPGGREAGKRRLRNTLLHLAMASGDADAEAEALEQFARATNLTDREAAFRAILLFGDDEEVVEETLEAFHRRYADNPIVLDKWFQLQALMPGKSSVRRVRKLTQHADFNWRNPNRVRAVIGSFTMGNQTGFNRADGAGYQFAADAIARLDRLNPQVAARLATAFRSWRMLEPDRRAMAQSVLRELVASPKLSTDVRDILDRTLA